MLYSLKSWETWSPVYIISILELDNFYDTSFSKSKSNFAEEAKLNRKVIGLEVIHGLSHKCFSQAFIMHSMRVWLYCNDPSLWVVSYVCSAQAWRLYCCFPSKSSFKPEPEWFIYIGCDSFSTFLLNSNCIRIRPLLKVPVSLIW